jgi:uncharacterized protein YdeI (YjbR/CyaY-like superfamily)
MPPELKDGIKTFYAKDIKAWRRWLEKNHDKEHRLWLIIYRKSSGIPSVYYSEAVDQALCFGWIDSKPNKRDDQSYYQFFSRRNPKSNWSKVNKLKVAQLLASGQMTPAGQALIDIAKQNGCWTALDEIEEAILPEDFQLALYKNKTACKNFEAFSYTSRKNIITWISSAKRAETRQKRIVESVEKAAQNLVANLYVKK